MNKLRKQLIGHFKIVPNVCSQCDNAIHPDNQVWIEHKGNRKLEMKCKGCYT